MRTRGERPILSSKTVLSDQFFDSKRAAYLCSVNQRKTIGWNTLSTQGQLNKGQEALFQRQVILKSNSNLLL